MNFLLFWFLGGALSKRTGSQPNRDKFGNDFVWRRYRKLTDVNNRLETEIDSLEIRIANLENKQLIMERDGMLRDEAMYNISIKLTRKN